MRKSYKTEINPTQEQIQKINKTIGTCRFIYNFYLAHNKEQGDGSAVGSEEMQGRGDPSGAVA